MSQTQQAARPILIELLGGASRQLTQDETFKLANWMTMATMVLDWADPDTRTIEREQREAFRLATPRKPPEGWAIFIKPYVGQSPGTLAWHRQLLIPRADGTVPMSPGEGDFTQVTIFILGSLAICAISHPLACQAGDSSMLASWFGVQSVWPVIGFPREAGPGGRPGPWTEEDIEPFMLQAPEFYFMPQFSPFGL